MEEGGAESLWMGFSMQTALWASLGSLTAWRLVSKIGVPRGPRRRNTACYELASKITRHRFYHILLDKNSHSTPPTFEEK